MVSHFSFSIFEKVACGPRKRISLKIDMFFDIFFKFLQSFSNFYFSFVVDIL